MVHVRIVIYRYTLQSLFSKTLHAGLSRCIRNIESRTRLREYQRFFTPTSPRRQLGIPLRWFCRLNGKKVEKANVVLYACAIDGEMGGGCALLRLYTTYTTFYISLGICVGIRQPGGERMLRKLNVDSIQLFVIGHRVIGSSPGQRGSYVTF